MTELSLRPPEKTITVVKLGPTLTANARQQLVGRDERERRLIADNQRGLLDDIARPPCTVDADINGPFTLTLEHEKDAFTLTLQNQLGEQRKATVPSSELEGFMLQSWGNLSKFSSRLSAPVAEYRRLLDGAKHGIHGVASGKLLQALEPQRVRISRETGEAIFSALLSIHAIEGQHNPHPDVVLTSQAPGPRR